MVNKLLPWPRNDWYETTWGELVELRYGKALQNYKEATSGFPVYGTNGPVGYNDKPLCEYPSVIVGRKGAYRGIHYSPTPFFVIDTAFYIEPHFDINLKWAYYELLQQDINGLDSGSAIPSTRREDFYALRVNVPPRDIQDQICKIPDLLNQKVSLNRKINQNLEQMAQTLFKSWFVDFDPVVDNALDTGFFEQDIEFPDELWHRAEARKAVRENGASPSLPSAIRMMFPVTFEKSSEPSLGLGGWIPKGWEICKLSDFGDIVCGKTPSKQDQSFYGNDISFIKIPDMHGNAFITKTSDNLSFNGSEYQIKKLLPENSICVSCIATVGLVSITTKPAHTNQQINSLIPRHKYFRDYLYFSLLNKNKYFHDLASGGSATLNMNTRVFSNVSIINPDEITLKLFQKESGALLEKIKHSLYEIDILINTRDTLLPKLISGELQLDEIKTDIAKVAIV